MANGDAGWRRGAGQEQWQPARSGHGDDGQRWPAAGHGGGGPNGTRPLRVPAPDQRGYPGAGPGAGGSAGPPGPGMGQGPVVPRRMMLAVLGAVVIGSAGAIAATASPKALATAGRRRHQAGETASSRARTRQQRRPAPAQPEYYIHDGPKAIALTIDDGPHPAYTPQVLAVLERYRVTALFSMVGQAVASYPQVAREVTDAGHATANHTWSHPDMATLHGSAMREEVTRATGQVHAATGQRPAMFRAPYGAWSPALLDYLTTQQLTRWPGQSTPATGPGPAPARSRPPSCAPPGPARSSSNTTEAATGRRPSPP